MGGLDQRGLDQVWRVELDAGPAAFLAGAETSIRIGLAVDGGFHHVGYHATGVVSHFASAVTAGRLLGLDEDQITAAQGVTVNAVAPSFVRTGFSLQRADPVVLDAYSERVRALTPLRALVRPADVANAVAFLASAQAARITGEVLHVCAGSQLPVFVR